jgi:hypothetical protein
MSETVVKLQHQVQSKVHCVLTAVSLNLRLMKRPPISRKNSKKPDVSVYYAQQAVGQLLQVKLCRKWAIQMYLTLVDLNNGKPLEAM